MKKLIKTLFLATILMVASACGSSKIQDDAIDKLETGFKKIAEMKSFDYTMNIEAKSENTEAKLYGSFSLSESLQASLAMDLSANGVNADKFMEFYLKDDTIFVSMLGQKQKQPAGLADLSNISFDQDTMTFNREKVKEAFTEATIDGEVVHLVLDKKLLEDNKSKIDSAASSVATVDTIKNAMVDIEFENDFMKKITMTFDAVIEEKEQTLSLIMSFDNINKVNEVTFPEDLDTYLEAEDTLLSDM